MVKETEKKKKKLLYLEFDWNAVWSKFKRIVWLYEDLIDYIIYGNHYVSYTLIFPCTLLDPKLILVQYFNTNFYTEKENIVGLRSDQLYDNSWLNMASIKCIINNLILDILKLEAAPNYSLNLIVLH